MADRAGSAQVCSEGHEGVSPTTQGAPVSAEDYLSELKRFAAALNGLPLLQTDQKTVEPAPLAAGSPAGGPAQAVDWTADENGDHEWWRELDARLARAPRRPRFGVRHSKRPFPPVTHTAAATEAPVPPLQLRRQIDTVSGSGEEARLVRRTGWDRLDNFFGVAGLTVALLGAVAASAPIGSDAASPALPVTTDLAVKLVEAAPVERPRPLAAVGSAVGPVTSLLPAPPPFPVTVALVSGGAVGTFVGPIGDRAFRPVTLVAVDPLSLDGALGAAALVDSVKADDVARQLDPLSVGVSEVVVSGVELTDADAQLPLVLAPVSAPQSPVPLNPGASAFADTEVTAAVVSAGGTVNSRSKQAWLAHLVSVRDDAGAVGEWERLQDRYAALGPLELSVRRVDLGDKGIWFRVYASPFKNREEASRLCALLTDQYCQPLPDKRG